MDRSVCKHGHTFDTLCELCLFEGNYTRPTSASPVTPSRPMTPRHDLEREAEDWANDFSQTHASTLCKDHGGHYALTQGYLAGAQNAQRWRKFATERPEKGDIGPHLVQGNMYAGAFEVDHWLDEKAWANHGERDVEFWLPIRELPAPPPPEQQENV